MTRYPPLAEILPHNPPMILLDRVEEASDEEATCSLTLAPGSPFVEQGSVPAVVATEYMAQSVAAYAGVKAHRKGDPVRAGYVIGAQTIDLAVDSFWVAQTLVIHARRIWGDDSLGKFECSVTCDGDRVAEAVLTVFQGDIDPVTPEEGGP